MSPKSSHIMCNPLGDQESFHFSAFRYWLNIKTEIVDSRIGWLKREFRLTADETRFVVTKNPKIITLGTGHVQVCKSLFSFLSHNLEKWD